MSMAQSAFDEFRASLSQLGQSAPSDDLSDEQRVARANNTFLARLDRRTAIDMDTCIHCGMCSEACHFFIATGDPRYTPAHKVEPLRRFYRREVSPLRWFYRPFVRKVDTDDLREWRELVYEACTGCGRCDMLCPMGINISTGINVMREAIAAAGLAPAELAALQDEQQNENTVFGVDTEALKAAVATLNEGGTAIPLDKSSADVLMLTTAVEVRLFPDSIAACAKIMDKSGADWTISSSAFEAANIGLISGDRAARQAAFGRIVEQAKACGAKTIVVPESGHAYQALRWECANDAAEALPFDVVAISEYIAAQLEAGTLDLNYKSDLTTVNYHDPCRLGRQGGVFEEPRALLQAMGLEVRETHSNRRENLCCGGGCGEYAIDHGATIRQRAFDLKRHESMTHALMLWSRGCNNCRINLAIGAQNSGWDKPVVSLVETVAESLAD